MYALVLGLAVGTVVFLIQIVLAKRYWYVRLVRGILTFLLSAGILVVSFFALWGINYYRPSLSEIAGLEVVPSPTEELTALCKELALEANELREGVSQGADGVARLPYSIDTAFSQVQESFEAASETYPFLKGSYGRPKAVLYSEGMSWLGISGIYFPFTFEPNVNVDMMATAIPFAACHETSHLLGFAREDESNFNAYLACMASEDITFQYSGTFNALIYSINALYSHDQDAYWEIMALLSDGVKRDIEANNAYWQQFEGPIQEAQSEVNDFYLKFHGQESGVASYGDMVDLLLALRRASQE